MKTKSFVFFLCFCVASLHAQTDLNTLFDEGVSNHNISINNNIKANYKTSEDIMKQNYGKMIYLNPRGIKCIKCHGLQGEEKIISYYKHKGKLKKLIAPAINNITYERFAKKLSYRSKTIMPSYTFTNDEIRNMYQYLTSAISSK